MVTIRKAIKKKTIERIKLDENPKFGLKKRDNDQISMKNISKFGWISYD